jgi:hypothetical protein
MIVGNKIHFAIEWEIRKKMPGWVFGQLRFWAANHPIGNWEDSVALNGVRNWMCMFANEVGHRTNLRLFSLPTKSAFDAIYNPVFQNGIKRAGDIENASIFFHHYISHLGMSAFDRYDVLLIESESQQRLLWRLSDEGNVHDVFLPYGEMQKVARAFCYLTRTTI